MRDREPEIHAAGASLAVVGNGNAEFARAFRDEFGLTEERQALWSYCLAVTRER